MPASTLAQVEEFLMLSVDNVSVPLETGMVLPALFVLTLKPGLLQDFHVYVLTATGTVKLVSNVLPTKSGSQLQ